MIKDKNVKKEGRKKHLKTLKGTMEGPEGSLYNSLKRFIDITALRDKFRLFV